jgi:hypothetical protein
MHGVQAIDRLHLVSPVFCLTSEGYNFYNNVLMVEYSQPELKIIIN